MTSPLWLAVGIGVFRHRTEPDLILFLLQLVPLERELKLLSKCVYGSSISAFRKQLKIISYSQ